MWLDIFLLAALAVCQGATGFWAFHVSIPAEYGAWARWGFAAITTLGIGLVVVIGIRSAREQGVAQQKMLDGVGSINIKLNRGLGEVREEIKNEPQTEVVHRVAHFQSVAKQIASSNDKLPFALQITILTDQEIASPAFLVGCDGPIGDGHVGSGSGMYLNKTIMITDDKRQLGFRWSSPSFVPEQPIVVTIFAVAPINCPTLRDARLIQFSLHP